MKKTALTRTLVICAVFSLLAVGFQAAIQVEGNFIWPTSFICITFPENDKTYYSNTFTMRYHASFSRTADYEVDHKWIVYSIDGGENITIVDEYGSPYDFKGSVTLSGLSAGQHYVEICAKNASYEWYWRDEYDRVYFNIFTSPSEYYLSLHSPKNGTYYSGPVLLNFTRFGHSPSSYSYLYAIDGQSIALGSGKYVENINYSIDMTYSWLYEECETWGWAYLPDLSAEAHNLTFCSLRQGEVYGDFQTVYFTVVELTAPVISSLSIENKTYSQNDLPLSFKVDESTSWMGYSIDGSANVTAEFSHHIGTRYYVITGNSFSKLTSGSHTLTVYANDTSGNMGASETVYFNVEVPFPTALLIVSVIVVAVIVGTGLFVYFKKRQRSQSP